MSEKFWLTIVILCIVAFSIPAGCTANRHRIIAEAIENGADPLEAKCAIESENNMSYLCLTIANKK